MLHDWRGNVRELENVIQRALLFCGGNTIEASHIVFDRPVTTTFQRTAQVRKVAVLIHTLEDADCTIGPDRQRRQYNSTNENRP